MQTSADPTPETTFQPLSGWPVLTTWLLALAAIYDIQISWMGKHTLFRGLAGKVLRATGGIAVDRTHRGNLVRQTPGGTFSEIWIWRRARGFRRAL